MKTKIRVSDCIYTAEYNPDDDTLTLWKDDIAPPMPLRLVIPPGDILSLVEFLRHAKYEENEPSDGNLTA